MSRPTAQTICEDLLYAIFLHAPPFLVHGDDSLIDVNTVEPMNFSMVCRSWRAVILSRPNLWAHIKIMGSFNQPVILYRFLSKWLQYSQSSPLKIRLHLYMSGQDDEGFALVTDIINTIAAEHVRLEDVDVYIDYPCTEHPFTLQLSPSLASFRVSFHREGNFRNPFKIRSVFRPYFLCYQHKLWKLSISNGMRWILPEHPRDALHLPNLSVLDICTDVTGNIEDFHRVLSACPNITTLYVQARRCVHSPSDHMSSSISGAVLLPLLTNLVISSKSYLRPKNVYNFGSPHCVSGVLRSVSTASLKFETRLSDYNFLLRWPCMHAQKHSAGPPNLRKVSIIRHSR